MSDLYPIQFLYGEIDSRTSQLLPTDRIEQFEVTRESLEEAIPILNSQGIKAFAQSLNIILVDIDKVGGVIYKMLPEKESVQVPLLPE